MGKLLMLLAIVAAGCAGEEDLDPTSPELHELVACSPDWTTAAGVSCERPCEDPHPTMRAADDNNPDVCIGSFISTRGTMRSATCYASMKFDYRGVDGCCVYDFEMLDSGGNPIRFAVCSP